MSAQRQGGAASFKVRFAALGERSQIQVVSVEACGRFARRSTDLGQAELGFESAGNTVGYLILKPENIVKRTIEMLGPDMRTSARIDQLRADAQTVASLSDRALQEVTHAQCARHLPHICIPALVSKARITCDDKEPRQPGDRRRDLFDDAVGKIFLSGVPAQVLERQHRD